MINITSELQILNQEHWECDFDQIEWTGIDFIYLSKPSYFVWLESVLMLELYMQILIITFVLQLMILLMNFKMQTWYQNDSQTLVHAFYPKLTKENTHTCMSRNPSKPL